MPVRLRFSSKRTTPGRVVRVSVTVIGWPMARGTLVRRYPRPDAGAVAAGAGAHDPGRHRPRARHGRRPVAVRATGPDPVEPGRGRLLRHRAQSRRGARAATPPPAARV